MKRHNLIAIAALTVLCAGTASAASAYGHDDAYGPMQETGPSVLTRAEVQAELFAARADGRMSHAGEIATPDSVLLAMEKHNRVMAMAAAAQQAQWEAQVASAQPEGTPPEVEALMAVPLAAGEQPDYLPPLSSGISGDGLKAAPMGNDDLVEELMPTTSSELITEPSPPLGYRPQEGLDVGAMQQPIVMLVEMDENGEPLFIETIDLD